MTFRPARSFALSVALSAGLAAVCGAEMIPLPYSAPDGGQGQWFVQQMGVLQQQGNQPLFTQAGALMISGQPMRPPVSQADYDDKNKELTLAFLATGPTRVTRRFKFEDAGVVRIVDVIENTTDRDLALNLSLATNINFGITDSQTIADPKKREITLGWAGNTGADRAALSLFGGKGAKTAPTVQAQPNNNNVSATVALKIPPHGRQAVVHWHGTFDNADAAVAWAGQLKETRDVADLPADLRRAIVNIASGSPGLPDGLELLRGTPTVDVLELKSGDTLRGELRPDAYTLGTTHGDVTIDARKVAGVINSDARQWLVTEGGEVFAGRMKAADVSITLAGGQAMRVPLDRVARLGYRTTSNDTPEWKADTPTAYLADGQRFAVDAPTDVVELVTRYGTLSLKPDQIAAVLTQPSAASHVVYLLDGSRIGGVVTATSLPLRPTQTAATRPSEFSPAELSRVQYKALPDDVGAGAATVGLLGDDRVAARLHGPVRLTTGFESISLAGEEIRSIARTRAGSDDVRVTTADGSSFRGTIEDPTVSLTLAIGTTLKVPWPAVRDYDNPSPYPSAGVVTKVETLVKQLDADDLKTRETAEAQLTAAGPSIASVLDKSLPSLPPEARDRVANILRTLRKDQPTPPSRLSPLPAVEP